MYEFCRIELLLVDSGIHILKGLGTGQPMATKKIVRKQAQKQLVDLLDEHLSQFTTVEQSKMHTKFERRISTRLDSDAKSTPRLRVANR